MKSINKLPQFAADLVAALDEAFPHRCIKPGESPELAHRYAGKRELVEFLLQLKQKADANPLQR